jgi:hypothetical protein
MRRAVYWLAVVAVSAMLTYLLVRLAERLDAGQLGGGVIGPIA